MELQGLPNRIMGLEVEYRAEGDMVPDGSQAYGRWVEHLLGTTYGRRLWLPNGGRLCLDVGSCIEADTPEVTSGWAAAAYDRALEQLMIERLTERLTGMVTPLRLRRETRRAAQRTMSDAQHRSSRTGLHENYLLRAADASRDMVARLAPFLVTRQLVGGAGAVVPTADGWQFWLSQRAPEVNQLAGHPSSPDLGLLKRTQSMYADQQKYRRFELTMGDVNILVEPAAAKYDLTLVALLLAENHRLPGIKLADPVAALHLTATRGGRAALSLDGGGTITSLQIQHRYLQAASQLVRQFDLAQFESSLSYWAHVLDRLEANDLAALNGRVDWVTKWLALQAAGGAALSPAAATELDHDYHLLCGGSGWPQRLRAAHDPAGFAAAVAQARATAPPGRARLRSQLHQLLLAHGHQPMLSWNSIGLPSALHLALDDPLASADHQWQQLRPRLTPYLRPA